MASIWIDPTRPILRPRRLVTVTTGIWNTWTGALWPMGHGVVGYNADDIRQTVERDELSK
ncbi:hypothetical protein N7471_009320 [Penicillium samsonianum]|jgi:hypothetical protein|uniref:uncharacterized protein n=1 Tax=Penicillium samsonianum TaxID=1882272 RepID=UPI002549ABC1|nr:uncharacterized protein N7471_009320 [Penicillium samsonianum]KAJ6128103.1 hypothetical protein N7471_009320 [Penicillium samsonianum]